MATLSEPRPASYPRLLAVYLGTFIGGIILFYAIIFVAEVYFNAVFPENSAMGLILICLSAMTTGNYWYSRERANPTSGRKWFLALLIVIVTAAIQFGLVYFIASAAGEFQQLSREFAGKDRNLIIGVIAGLMLIEFLMIRASIWSGVRNGIKQEQRKAEKLSKSR